VSEAPLDANRTTVFTSAMLASSSAAFEPREHLLVLVEGWQPGLVVRLSGRPLRLGRREGNDQVLPDHRVSGQHCEIVVVPGPGNHLEVRDLGSTNGTFVDDARVASVRVR
jgi:pSer/pThr/pTyr-binding forkhead associated (FHA) protein